MMLLTVQLQPLYRSLGSMHHHGWAVAVFHRNGALTKHRQQSDAVQLYGLILARQLSDFVSVTFVKCIRTRHSVHRSPLGMIRQF